MAGLQYKFFPTDFLFPLQPPAAATTPNGGVDIPVRQVSLVKSEDLKQPIASSVTKIVKAIPSSSVAYSPIIIHKQK
ncbi:hypothetical protein C2S53_020485 [Perilla frutescens var. hirtella]|uniref:Uncharacterized protein n=1 Tax=Perilla frutescens var. hirtella TaxID=608512 RepID=A0AAD4PAC9_PERFH|nr:hypothetical protein C2S53_020485 [Perilla frutescens var. hirtella]